MMGDFDKAKVCDRGNFAIAGSMIIEAGSLFFDNGFHSFW
jgi:hypothetical protein